jgi:hypothetical protein
MTDSTLSSAPGPDAPTAPTKKRSAARFVTPALALVAALGIGVFGGVLIGQSTASATQAGQVVGGAGAAGGFPGGGTAPDAMGGFTSGTVVSVDGSTVVLELTDGSQVTVTASADTTVTTTEDSSVDALAAGDTITVVGDADDAGIVTATTISEGATGFDGGMGGGTPPTTTPAG